MNLLNKIKNKFLLYKNNDFSLLLKQFLSNKDDDIINLIIKHIKRQRNRINANKNYYNNTSFIDFNFKDFFTIEKEDSLLKLYKTKYFIMSEDLIVFLLQNKKEYFLNSIIKENFFDNHRLFERTLNSICKKIYIETNCMNEISLNLLTKTELFKSTTKVLGNDELTFCCKDIYDKEEYLFFLENLCLNLINTYFKNAQNKDLKNGSFLYLILCKNETLINAFISPRFNYSTYITNNIYSKEPQSNQFLQELAKQKMLLFNSQHIELLAILNQFSILDQLTQHPDINILENHQEPIIINWYQNKIIIPSNKSSLENLLPKTTKTKKTTL